jgi:hypothetical protein
VRVPFLGGTASKARSLPVETLGTWVITPDLSSSLQLYSDLLNCHPVPESVAPCQNGEVIES